MRMVELRRAVVQAPKAPARGMSSSTVLPPEVPPSVGIEEGYRKFLADGGFVPRELVLDCQPAVTIKGITRRADYKYPSSKAEIESEVKAVLEGLTCSYEWDLKNDVFNDCGLQYSQARSFASEIEDRLGIDILVDAAFEFKSLWASWSNQQLGSGHLILAKPVLSDLIDYLAECLGVVK